jgi:perosamine synthetase
MNILAINGGTPIRETLLPYAKPSVSDADRIAVEEVLKTDWLTTGPRVAEFEKAFAAFTNAKEAVAVNSGTAALHAAYFAGGITKGDEVIVPTMTFAATANAAAFLGATPVFADSDPDTLLIDPKSVESRITEKTKAIVAVDYAGQPCDYDALRSIADAHGLTLIADACHAVDAQYKGERVGSIADFSTFSFHPVKPLATGEGGMITTNDSDAAMRMRSFRNHGINSDHKQRHDERSWYYEMRDLGYNYRMPDINCALGISQLKSVPAWTKRRQQIAAKYDEAFAKLDAITPLAIGSDRTHAYHLYVIQCKGMERKEVFAALHAENIGVNVHYIPVHLHPWYQSNFKTQKGLCPIAEAAYEKMLSLPMFAAMTDRDIDDVIAAVQKVAAHFAA